MQRLAALIPSVPVLLAVALVWAVGAPALAAEEKDVPGPEFRRALRLLQDSSPQRRAEGERLLRAMGSRAVSHLREWIETSEASLDRARALLHELSGGQPGLDDDRSLARGLFARRVRGAWERFRNGEYLEAKKDAEAVLRLDPESPEIWQIRRLIRLSEERLITSELLQPSVEFRETLLGLDGEPQVLFRLTNRSKARLGVRAEKSILGSLQINYRRRYMDGSLQSDERTMILRCEGEGRINLEPGESYVREVPIPLEDSRARAGMALRIRVVGKFQPSQWGLEERNLSRTLTLAPAECWMVPPEQKDLAEVPLRKLASALILEDLEGYFVGGQLAVWAAEADPLLNEKLLRVLVESLGELSPTGLQVAEALLEEASGHRRDRNLQTPEAVRRHWERWWSEEHRGAETPRSQVPPGEGARPPAPAGAPLEERRP